MDIMENKFFSIEKLGEVDYEYEKDCSLIAKGKIGKHSFAIINRLLGPCSYIKLEKDSPFYDNFYEDIPLDCHGGLTYGENGTNLGYDEIEEGFWIGWDYCHLSDYIAGSKSKIDHKWTYEELIREMLYVCGKLDALETGIKEERNND